MLDALTVVEIGDSVASSAAGALCLRLGADVVKVRPEPQHVASDSRPKTQKRRLIELLDRGKRSAETTGDWAPDALSLAAQADLTIVDLTESTDAREPRTLRAYEDVVRQSNANCWVTISPFGLKGPLRHRRGAELTIAASGGIANYMRSSLGRPMKPAGFTASVTAGHFAVLAGLHGLLLRRDGGHAVHMDVSAQETVIVTGVFLECAHRLFECAGEGGSGRYAAPRGLIECATGYIWIVVLEDHQWRACIDAMGNPAWAATISTGADRQDQNSFIQRKLTEWASAHTARDAAEILQAHGVPAVTVNSCADLLSGVGLDVRQDFFVDDGRGARVPDVPFELIRMSPPRGRTGRKSPDPRRPYRVLDMTQVLIGPLATSWLGAMGVDVLKIEDPERMDVYRRRGPFLNDVPGPEQSAYFSFANYSKRSHAAALGTPAGRARMDALIASADVVVHNLMQRALTLGLTHEHVHGELGSFLVSSSGYGRTTGYATHRAYGMNIQAAGGVVYLSRDRANQPVNLGTSWADPLSAVWVAITTLAQLLRPELERQSIDISMVEVVAHEFREYFEALTRDGIEIRGDESRLDHAAPHGIYSCAGEDRWFALSIESDAEWSRFLDALDRPDSLDRPAWATLESRLAAQDELDAALDRALAERSGAELFEALQASDISCAPVWGAADLISSEHLHARGLFQPVGHPVWGSRPLIGLPWLVDGSAAPLSATPLLGENTTDDPSRWWSS